MSTRQVESNQPDALDIKSKGENLGGRRIQGELYLSIPSLFMV
jgi:hypothetical protein